MGRSAQHTVEGELCSLLAQLIGQVGDLTAQIINVHAVEGRQTLLCSGQLRLQALYSGPDERLRPDRAAASLR